MKLSYRAYCCNGVKSFDCGQEALDYYLKQMIQGKDVELWSVVTEETKKVYKSTQRLMGKYESNNLYYKGGLVYDE